MAQQFVDFSSSVAVRRPRGQTVTFVNQSAVDVYLDTNQWNLNSAPSGTVPNSGVKLAANGGQYTWLNFPGLAWLRAISATTIQVLP